MEAIEVGRGPVHLIVPARIQAMMTGVTHIERSRKPRGGKWDIKLVYEDFTTEFCFVPVDIFSQVDYFALVSYVQSQRQVAKYGEGE